MLDGVSLEQLRAFIAAADEGSFSAAGRRLKRAQSVVSQTVSHLEDKLGVRLFDRTARFPVLTDQGRALLADARAVTGQMELLKGRAKGLAGGSEPELTIAVDVMFPNALLTGAMTALQDLFPETAVRLYVEGWGAVIQRVLDRRCGIGVMASLISTPPQLAHERLMTIKMALVVSSQHPLATHRRPIPTATLAKHILLMHTDRPDYPPGREWTPPSPKIWFVAHLEVKLAFLRAGLGFGAMPLHVVERDLASGALVQISAEESPPRGHTMEVFAFYRMDSPPGPVGRWLIDRLRQEDGQRLGKSTGVSPSTVKPKSSRSRSPSSKHRR
jgi:DNA-binding transcriptional LysR family regulator